MSRIHYESSKENFSYLRKARRNQGRETIASSRESTPASREQSKLDATQLDATRATTLIKYGTAQTLEVGREPRSTASASGYPYQIVRATANGHGLLTRKASKL